jgi:hypothetical protein
MDNNITAKIEPQLKVEVQTTGIKFLPDANFGMRYILRANGDDIAMFVSIHLAKVVGYVCSFAGKGDIEIYDTITKRNII